MDARLRRAGFRRGRGRGYDEPALMLAREMRAGQARNYLPLPALPCYRPTRLLHTGMAKKPGTNKSEFVFFDVVYEDGSQRSNRRVPAELLGGLEGDEPARGFIIEQDRDIAQRSGTPPLAIKSIARVGAKPKKDITKKLAKA